MAFYWAARTRTEDGVFLRVDGGGGAGGEAGRDLRDAVFFVFVRIATSTGTLRERERERERALALEHE